MKGCAVAGPSIGARRRAPAGAVCPARGFTLVEVIVAVALMALASGIMVPALGGMARAELRRSARMLAANVRRCFDEAALSGQTYRLVFNLGGTQADALDPNEAPPIAIESSELALNFTGHDGALSEASDPNEVDSLQGSPLQDALGQNEAAPPDAGGNVGTDPASASGEMFRSMFNINRLAQKAGRPNFETVGTVDLPRGVHVSDVFFDGMHAAAADGSLALIFFATGYTQHAIIHLEDRDKNAFTLEVEPLTGRTHVAEGYLSSILGDQR